MKIRSQNIFVACGGVVLALLMLIGLFYAFNEFIYKQKQGDNAIVPYRATLTGEYICLPHTDTRGPQTLECAFGLKTDVGEYYAIDFAMMSQEHRLIETGKRISANGVVTPVAMLSSDHWRQYPIEGIFSVTDSLEVYE